MAATVMAQQQRYGKHALILPTAAEKKEKRQRAARGGLDSVQECDGDSDCCNSDDCPDPSHHAEGGPPMAEKRAMGMGGTFDWPCQYALTTAPAPLLPTVLLPLLIGIVVPVGLGYALLGSGDIGRLLALLDHTATACLLLMAALFAVHYTTPRSRNFPTTVSPLLTASDQRSSCPVRCIWPSWSVAAFAADYIEGRIVPASPHTPLSLLTDQAVWTQRHGQYRLDRLCHQLRQWLEYRGVARMAWLTRHSPEWLPLEDDDFHRAYLGPSLDRRCGRLASAVDLPCRTAHCCTPRTRHAEHNDKNDAYDDDDDDGGGEEDRPTRALMALQQRARHALFDSLARAGHPRCLDLTAGPGQAWHAPLSDRQRKRWCAAGGHRAVVWRSAGEYVAPDQFHALLSEARQLLTLPAKSSDMPSLLLLQVDGRSWTGFGSCDNVDAEWCAFVTRYVPRQFAAVRPLSWYTHTLAQHGFEVVRVETLSEHWAATHRLWYERWCSRRAEIAARYGDRVWRVWALYLAWTTVAIRCGRLCHYQIIAQPK